jgi:hypothetical protein
MPVDPQLLSQALRTPESQEVAESPIVRAVVLADPSNVSDLVPLLARPDTLEGRNARRVVCHFQADAVPPLLAALASATSATARMQGVEMLWTLLAGEEPHVIRAALGESAGDLTALLQDTTPLPVEYPEYIEVDFTGRVCDLAYIVVRELLDRDFDQSGFRALDDEGRDADIRRMVARGVHEIA